ncbi:hypothetical protein MAR_023471 [Mya arenaria]|uniref:Uncharacterized protein n=1 Tax=Mya arenaria TaxID=6604 RepID=A0ABY7DQD2_MYAAR|nr:hypothetical protein MAR_023471 [Mya arenaria]
MYPSETMEAEGTGFFGTANDICYMYNSIRKRQEMERDGLTVELFWIALFSYMKNPALIYCLRWAYPNNSAFMGKSGQIWATSHKLGARGQKVGQSADSQVKSKMAAKMNRQLWNILESKFLLNETV